MLIYFQNPEFRFKKDVDVNLQKNQEIEKCLMAHQVNKEDRRFIVIGLKDFLKLFSELHLLADTNLVVQNSFSVDTSVKINQPSEDI